MPLATGTVQSLYRWPVKSMGGEELPELVLDGRGVAGDRAHAVLDEFRGESRRLTARQVPRLLDWSARYERASFAADAPPPAQLTAPDGRAFGWDAPELADVLSADLGRPVSLAREPRLMQDLPNSVLVTVSASHHAVERELGPLSLLRWRTNLHVVLDAEAFAEERWEGAQLEVGGLRFALLHPCRRCVIPTRNPGADDQPQRWPQLLRWLAEEREVLFGINARPLQAGTVAVGDAVAVHAA